MAVSNPATLLSVQQEFGGNGQLRQYARGGGLVPNGPAQNNNISTDPNTLRLNQFAGAVRYSLTASLNRSTANNNASGNSASGRVYTPLVTCQPSGGSGNYSYYWNYSAGTPGNGGNTAQSFEIYADLGSGQSLSGNANCTVTDNVTGQQVFAGSFTYTISWFYDRPSCVVVEAFLHDGRRAGSFNNNDPLMLVDPYAGTSELRNIAEAMTFKRECVTLVTAGGARLTCSTTAPIPVRGVVEQLVSAENALGQYVATTQCPNDLIPAVTWDQVVQVIPVGARDVRHIYIYDKCFWASDDNRSFILHHNTTGKQII